MSLRGAKRRGNLNSIYNNSYVSHSIRAPPWCHHTILDCRAALAMTIILRGWQAGARNDNTIDELVCDDTIYEFSPANHASYSMHLVIIGIA